MARGNWNYVAGSTNDSRLLGGIAWRYRDDLFGTSGYPSSRIGSNSDIIEYTPYLGRNTTDIYSRNGNLYTSNYKYSYNTQSGINPGNPENQLNVSTTYDFRNASVNNYYRLEDTSQSVANASSNRSRIIVVPHCTDGTSIIRLYFYYNGGSGTAFSRSETNALITLERINRAPLLTITKTAISPKSYGFNITNEYGFGLREVKYKYPNGIPYQIDFGKTVSMYTFIDSAANIQPNTEYTFTDISARTYEDYWSDPVDFTVKTDITPTIILPTTFVQGDNTIKLSNYNNVNAFTLNAKLICEVDDYEIDLGSVSGTNADVVLNISDDIFDDFAEHCVNTRTGTIVVNGTVNYRYGTAASNITYNDIFEEVTGELDLSVFDDYSSLKPTLRTPISHTVDSETQTFTQTGVILGHTDMTLTIPASTAKYTTSGADVDKYRLQIGTQDIYIDASSTQSVNYTIEGLSVSSFKISVIDTRGIESDELTYNYTSYSYIKPTISSQSIAVRNSTDLEDITLTLTGTYTYFNDFTIHNYIKPYISSPLSSGINISWMNEETLVTTPLNGTLTSSNGTFTFTGSTSYAEGSGFDITKSYQVTVTATDLVGESGSLTFTLEPGSGTIVIDKRNKRVGINTLPDEYPFEVNGDINIVGDDPKFRINGEAFEGGSGEMTPIGTISQWGTNTPPDGWLICDGSAISRTAYDKLFAVIGTTYGAGDGSTTFNLPDLRDKVPQGAGEIGNVGDSIDAGLPNITGTLTGAPGGSNAAYDWGFKPDTTANNFVNVQQTGSTYNKYGGAYNANNGTVANFNASRSNSIYGNSDTVQPNATIVCFIIKYAQVSTEQLPSEAGIPVGSILEFNGTEDQIPVGYAKYTGSLTKSIAKMNTTAIKSYAAGSYNYIEYNEQSLNIGNFICDTTNFRIKIPAGTAKYIKITGGIAGSGHHWGYYVITDDNGNNPDGYHDVRDGTLFQSTGNGYYNIPTKTTILELDTTKNWYVQYKIAGYNSQTFNCNNGFNVKGTYIQVEEL